MGHQQDNNHQSWLLLFLVKNQCWLCSTPIWKGIHTLVPSSVCHCLWKRQFSTNYQSQLVQGGEVADEKRTVSFQPMPYVGVLTRSLLDPYTPHGSDCLRMNSSDIHFLKSSHNANWSYFSRLYSPWWKPYRDIPMIKVHLARRPSNWNLSKEVQTLQSILHPKQ